MAGDVHRELVERGRGWLRRQGCAIVFAELCVPTITGELPDVIGWRDGLSIVIEAKASRADFLTDRHKPFRCDPSLGMGDWRYYLTPPGVVKPEDVPGGWGLLWAHPRKIERVHGGPAGNCDWHRERPFTANMNAERKFLVSALRRLQLHHGVPVMDELIHATYASKQAAAPTQEKGNG